MQISFLNRHLKEDRKSTFICPRARSQLFGSRQTPNDASRPFPISICNRKDLSDADNKTSGMTERVNTELASDIDQLVEEATRLFASVIAKTKISNNRSKIQHLKWTERHRLNVLIDAALETRKSLPRKAIVAPWFLAELKATIEIARKWHDSPLWKEIEPSLVNPYHFTHTIAKLQIADFLKRQGHGVRIVPTRDVVSPDLVVQAIGGTEDWAEIECYQPISLHGDGKVSPKDVEKIVKKAMKKAKRQLDISTPGILAICGFNQSKEVVESLKRLTADRLGKTDRPNFCGFLLAMLGIYYKKDDRGLHFTPTISIDFVHNPSYFGRVDIVSDVATNDPRLIKEPLTDLSTDELVSDHLIPHNAMQNVEIAEPKLENSMSNIREVRLPIIEKPAVSSRAVFDYSDVQPKLKGEGNTNYLCGFCGALLVEHAWKQSLSNAVLKCPSCHSYNELEKIDVPEKGIVGKIAFEVGEYHLTEVVRLKRGVFCFGL